MLRRLPQEGYLDNDALQRIATSLEKIQALLEQLIQPRVQTEEETTSTESAKEYLTLDDLYTLVETQEGFGKQNATSLWRVLTTNPPDDNEAIFDVLVGNNGRRLTVEDYRRTRRYYSTFRIPGS